jgi:molybdate transport repressor ModE-like protein
MVRIDIRPVWRIRSGDAEREFDFQLVTILERLDATSKLTQAAETAEISYRHAWNMIVEWEGFFGAPLVDKARGRGTTLTPLGRRLLWAARRAQARLAPELDNLGAEFARTLNASLSDAAPGLAVQASHDYAIGLLRDMHDETRPAMELHYRGSFDALAALRRGECDIAGFHVPDGPMSGLMIRRYAECLPMDAHRVISFVTRTQGLIVRAGNPKRIRGVADLAREDVRMVNRQRGSGTRALLEFLISAQALDRTRLRGYDSEETTHAAVAALIAGNQADAGFGVEAAAENYRLGFVPVCRERYYLACRAEELDSPAMRELLLLLRSGVFRTRVSGLPGYSAPDAGVIHSRLESGVSAAGP